METQVVNRIDDELNANRILDVDGNSDDRHEWQANKEAEEKQKKTQTEMNLKNNYIKIDSKYIKEDYIKDIDVFIEENSEIKNIGKLKEVTTKQGTYWENGTVTFSTTIAKFIDTNNAETEIPIHDTSKSINASLYIQKTDEEKFNKNIESINSNKNKTSDINKKGLFSFLNTPKNDKIPKEKGLFSFLNTPKNDKEQVMKEIEVFEASENFFKENICYAMAKQTRESLDSKYFTTNNLEYVGKFVKTEISGRQHDPDLNYLFTKDNENTLKVDDIHVKANKIRFKEVPCNTTGGKPRSKRSRKNKNKNKKSKNTRRKSIRRRRR